MRGGPHFVMNAASAFAVLDGYLLLTQTAAAPSVKPTLEAAVGWMTDFQGMSAPVGIALSLLGYMCGALLPDIDTPYSSFGKRVHVNVKHRTWTHTAWFVAIFAILGYWFRPAVWLALGTFFHIFWDGFSVSGVHWFYPWRKHKGHIFKLYSTGETSEKVVMVIGVVLSITFTVFTVWRLIMARDAALTSMQMM